MATILHGKGDRSPSLFDTIKVDGSVFDLTGSSVKFQMRPEGSATLKVDSAAVIVSATAGTVRYDWAAADVDTEGDYIGWWLVTLPSGKTQKSPRFSIQMEDRLAVALSTRALVGLRETKDWLENNNIDTSDDLKITALINAVSDEAMKLTGREFKVFGTNPQTRTFTVDSVASRYGYIKVGDLTSFTALTTLDNDWATTLETVNTTYIKALPLNRRPWEPIRALQVNWKMAGFPWHSDYLLQVTGTWGFPSVPEDVKHAVKDTVAYRLDRDVEHPRETLGAIPGASDAGSALIVQAQPRILAFPPEPYATLTKYRDSVIF